MIVTEYLNEGTLVKRYSDAGMLIERDGVRYSEAIDPIEFKDVRIYTETDESIQGEQMNKQSEMKVD